MLRVLLSVDDSRDSRLAVRHVIKAFTTNTAMEIHVLNVQPPLRRHIAQFVSKQNREAFYRDEAEKALRPVRRMLDKAGTPYSVHTEVGTKARVITATASRLRCDHIVIGAPRRNALMRMIEDSVTDKVLGLTTVPVVVIAGERASKAERYGVPAAVGAVLALLLFAATD